MTTPSISFYLPPASDAQKWDGSTSAVQFLETFESMIVQNRWTDNVATHNLLLNITGAARNWFLEYREKLYKDQKVSEYKDIKYDWAEVSKNLRASFTSKDTVESLEAKLNATRYQEDEDPELYYYSQMRTITKMDPSMPVARRISYLIRGLPSILKREIYMRDPQKCEDILAYLLRIKKFQHLQAAMQAEKSYAEQVNVLTDRIKQLEATYEEDSDYNQEENNDNYEEYNQNDGDSSSSSSGRGRERPYQSSYRENRYNGRNYNEEYHKNQYEEDRHNSPAGPSQGRTSNPKRSHVGQSQEKNKSNDIIREVENSAQKQENYNNESFTDRILRSQRRTFATEPSQVLCWNCNQKGHTSRFCPN